MRRIYIRSSVLSFSTKSTAIGSKGNHNGTQELVFFAAQPQVGFGWSSYILRNP